MLDLRLLAHFPFDARGDVECLAIFGLPETTARRSVQTFDLGQHCVDFI
jgi:hypothetical protein